MRKKNKVLVLGYFGYANNQLDGQTIKTRNIYDLLKSKEREVDYNINYFDTYIFRLNKFNVLKMFLLVCRCDILIYIPAHNNLKYFFPILYFLCRLNRINIHYIVVGGWLAGFIREKPLHIKLLRKIQGIYPQTKILCSDLESKYNFKNVHQLNNFRLHNYTNSSSDCTSKNDIKGFKLVFMARVHPLKGVGVIFKLANRLQKEGFTDSIIDIYGPIYDDYQSEFEVDLIKCDNVNYRGVLQQEDIYKTLGRYDMMLFPTKYFTEGFPGSILDAYISGIPVIATHWKYAEEFVQHNVCGVITDFDNDDNFVSAVINAISSPDYLQMLKIGAENQAQKYNADSAWSLLKAKVF